MPVNQIILGSRSPRRKELLSQLIPEENITVIPPQNPEEAGFEQLFDLDSIHKQLIHICETKSEDVFQQMIKQGASRSTPLLTADTIVVVERDESRFHVLGQPPDNHTWKQTVRSWFLENYAGKTHRVITGYCFRQNDDIITEMAQTFVTFHNRDSVFPHLEWYLSTEEPLGKAGGYAVQGAGSIFIKRIEGSLSNVVGLPLENLLKLFQ